MAHDSRHIRKILVSGWVEEHKFDACLKMLDLSKSDTLRLAVDALHEKLSYPKTKWEDIPSEDDVAPEDR
jgi:hypothetical protein